MTTEAVREYFCSPVRCKRQDWASDWKNSVLFYIHRRVITVAGKIENIDLPPRDMRSQRKFLQQVARKRVGQWNNWVNIFVRWLPICYFYWTLTARCRVFGLDDFITRLPATCQFCCAAMSFNLYNFKCHSGTVSLPAANANLPSATLSH